MIEYGGLFYIGLENGEIWQYDEQEFVLISVFLNPIKSLFSDNNLLFATEKNEETIYLYNGISFTNIS